MLRLIGMQQEHNVNFLVTPTVGEKVVLNLSQDLLDKGHYAYFDNFYTSPRHVQEDTVMYLIEEWEAVAQSILTG